MKNLENIQGSRFYGRRQSKPLKKSSATRLKKYFPIYSVVLPEDGLLDYQKLFSHNPDEIWLEIGFGKGEHLKEQAKSNPHIGILGCEPFINGVSGLVDHIHKENLSNVRFFMDDARLLMDALPDASISRVFILFPDPWPKKRHHKRRVVCAGNLKVISRILKDGAELRIATDHQDYRRWILARLLENSDFTWQADGPENWHKRSADWPATRYEQKALEAGRKSAYMTFIRTSRKQVA